MEFGLTDNEKYLLKKIEILEKQVDRLEWRVLHLEAFDDHPRATKKEEEPASSISDEEAEELAEDDNFLNDLIDYVNENYGENTVTLIDEQ